MQMAPVGDTGNGETFAFNSRVWAELFPDNSNVFVLQQQHRFTNDPPLQILNDAMRTAEGEINSTLMNMLAGRHQQDVPLAPLHETVPRIYPHREAAEMFNSVMDQANQNPQHTYAAKMTGNWLDAFGADPVVPVQLSLKVNTPVMLVYNVDVPKKLVNGSIGVVIGFAEKHPFYPIVRFKSGSAIVCNQSRGE